MHAALHATEFFPGTLLEELYKRFVIPQASLAEMED
jgi:hypothetical protein